MKRLLSIFFAAVLAFNLFGYRVLINWLQAQQAATFSQKIERGVSKAELLSVKVPATLPYYTNASDFQRVDGEVTIDGVVYQYVERRIYNDSIEFRCLKNNEKTTLQNTRDLFFRLAHSVQGHNHPGGDQSPAKPLLLEYCAFGKSLELPEAERLFVRQQVRFKQKFATEVHAFSHEKPPEAAA